MENKEYLKDLDVLDISVLLKSLTYEAEFEFVAELVKYSFYVVLDDVETNGSIPLDSHYSVAEDRQQIVDKFESFWSKLLQLQGALLQEIHLNFVNKEHEIIDMKSLFLLLSPERNIDFIDMFLKYVDKAIKITNVIYKHSSSDKKEYKDIIDKLEELNNIFIAIREEEVKHPKHFLTDDDELPF